MECSMALVDKSVYCLRNIRNHGFGSGRSRRFYHTSCGLAMAFQYQVNANTS